MDLSFQQNMSAQRGKGSSALGLRKHISFQLKTFHSLPLIVVFAAFSCSRHVSAESVASQLLSNCLPETFSAKYAVTRTVAPDRIMSDADIQETLKLQRQALAAKMPNDAKLEETMVQAEKTIRDNNRTVSHEFTVTFHRTSATTFRSTSYDADKVFADLEYDGTRFLAYMAYGHAPDGKHATISPAIVKALPLSTASGEDFLAPYLPSLAGPTFRLADASLSNDETSHLLVTGSLAGAPSGQKKYIYAFATNPPHRLLFIRYEQAGSVQTKVDLEYDDRPIPTMVHVANHTGRYSYSWSYRLTEFLPKVDSADHLDIRPGEMIVDMRQDGNVRTYNWKVGGLSDSDIVAINQARGAPSFSPKSESKINWSKILLICGALLVVAGGIIRFSRKTS